ncbi:SDR family NAD(P)-dependent oxidoreductase [Pseudoalteromonas sp. T1lg88]|uniref:SDR family NAD(P)-dependent oxidoreductase n=1 Tax=Pseudoalteromonas sp. T1lg88 TaxID=2077104 RepID=UPI000CF60134|nr:SDR family oxidoreductase [Pseudoalteromonas sp. T1lg88]
MNILITGGGGDLAKYVAVKLRELGHVVDAPTRQELDVASIQRVNTFFTGKRYDAVINNAGTLYSSLVAESDPILWIRDIEANLIGTYLVSREAVRANKDVHLVNVASTAAFNSYKDWTSYCAAKAGVVTLSRGMYKDGYSVTVMCPGAIETKIRNGLLIQNPNIMSVEEGAVPILKAVQEKQVDTLVFYRKNEHRIEAL